jgi:restriction system protein
MSPEAILAEVEKILANTKVIPKNRKYWMFRTQGGEYYETFSANNFVAINYDEIKLSQIDGIRKAFAVDDWGAHKALREIIQTTYKKENRPGLVASQLFRFVYDIKKDDVVVIPSSSSGHVNFGYVKARPLLNVSQSDIKKSGCPYEKRKGVSWALNQSRNSLDPYLYKAFQAHQAINDISSYAEIIERTLGNFYVQEDEANLVIEVSQRNKIPAPALFSLGYNLLKYSQHYFDSQKLPLTIDAVDVKINVNSPGKIQLKSPSRGTLILIGLLIVGIGGGGFKVNYGGFNLDLSTPGVVKTIIDYQNSAQDRAIKEDLVKSIDSLQVKTPDDLIKVLKQFSENKDKAK